MSRWLFLFINLLVLALMALSPWAVPARDFDGSGHLLNPLGPINPAGIALPDGLSFGWLGLLFGLWVLILVAATVFYFMPNSPGKARLFYILGGVGLAVFTIEAIWFYQSINSFNNAAIAAGASRPPLRRFALGLGMYMGLFYSVGMLVLARLQQPGGRAFFVRYRNTVVPVISLLLAIVMGALIVGILRPGIGTQGIENLSLRDNIGTKLDLVTYTYQILLSPIISLAGVVSSLTFATPLILAGLAVAFGFAAGVFNIGAPGQIAMGAVFAMLAGVYLPLPGWLLLPATVVAAMIGGGLWGAIPGWLRARFGASEVINTIMMNYIAASVMLFLLASNQYLFFGNPVSLPFKAEGLEARSERLQEGARLPYMKDVLVPGGEFSWALPLAVLAAIGVYFGMRRLDLGRRLLLAGGALVVGWIVGGFLPGFQVQLSSSVTSLTLNASFLIAILACLFYNFYLFRSSGGYELRATGLAPKAAEYAGVNLNRKAVLAMFISGALAGLVATHYVMGAAANQGEYRLYQSITVSVGFDGIAVALMGQIQPIGIFLASLLFGVLLAGGPSLNQQLGISPQLIQVLQGMIIMFIAVGGLLPRYFTDPLRAAQVETEAKAERDALEAKKAGA
jgi:general nucleoside transport system permease protein